MLYYFNFVQGGYFKAATPEGLADAKAKLAPSALWWFRWGAMFTFLTGLYLLHTLGGTLIANDYIMVGALLGTFMFLNVWLVIWPAQKIALGHGGRRRSCCWRKSFIGFSYEHFVFFPNGLFHVGISPQETICRWSRQRPVHRACGSRYSRDQCVNG